MKKRTADISVLLLIFTTMTLMPERAGAQTEGHWVFYRSNAAGMALEKIPAPVEPEGMEEVERKVSEARDRPAQERARPVFVLKKRSLPSGGEVELLLEEGEAVYRVERKMTKAGFAEREFRDGEKVRERIEREGKPVFEWVLNNDGSSTERNYYREDGRLISCIETEYRGEEKIAAKSILYVTDSSGKLGQVRKNGELSSYVFDSEGTLRCEWHTGTETDETDSREIELVSYSRNGGYRMETGDKEGPIRVRRSVAQNGGVMVETRNVQSGVEIREWYDEADRLVRRITRGEEGLRRETYGYENGRLESERLRSPGTDREKAYFYDNEGEIMMVRVTEQGELSREIVYRKDEERLETIYRNGEPLYRNLYRGEDLVKREYIE